MPGPLWEATRSLHHACEAHAVGKAMATGKPPAEWYARWLEALRAIHDVVDPSLPKCLHRSARLVDDVAELPLEAPKSHVARQYAIELDTERKIAGAAYVLTGAHLMGGEIMRRRLEGYPTSHLLWDDRKEALVELNKLRERDDIAEEAKACFHALLCIMDEIEERSEVCPEKNIGS